MFFQDSACRGWTWKDGYVDLVEVLEGLGQLPGVLGHLDRSQRAGLCFMLSAQRGWWW